MWTEFGEPLLLRSVGIFLWCFFYRLGGHAVFGFFYVAGAFPSLAMLLIGFLSWEVGILVAGLRRRPPQSGDSCCP